MHALFSGSKFQGTAWVPYGEHTVLSCTDRVLLLSCRDNPSVQSIHAGDTLPTEQQPHLLSFMRPYAMVLRW